jgi:hypothetical protein
VLMPAPLKKSGIKEGAGKRKGRLLQVAISLETLRTEVRHIEPLFGLKAPCVCRLPDWSSTNLS